MKHTRIPLVLVTLSLTIILIITNCSYNDNIIDPNNPRPALFTLQGKLDEAIPKDLFSESKSTQIGLIPAVQAIITDKPIPSEKQSSEFYKKFIEEYNNEEEFTLPTTIQTDCIPITFNGEFPLNFKSELTTLPSEDDLRTIRTPSGKEYKIGIFIIGLFDDVNNDKKINMNLNASEIITQEDTASNIITEFPLWKYDTDSDSLIAIVPDHFIIFVDNSALVSELNQYISENLNATKCWNGLSNGYNLVTFTSEITDEWDIETIDFPEYENKYYLGVQSIAQESDITLTQCSFTDTSNTFDVPAFYCHRIFCFNPLYSPNDYASITVKLPVTSDTIVIKSDLPKSHFGTRYYKTYIPFNDDKEHPILKIAVEASGFFDYGHLNNPCEVSSFRVNSYSMTRSAGPYYMPPGKQQDTLFVNSDTLTIGFKDLPESRCKNGPIPHMIDSVSIIVNSENLTRIP